MKEVRCRYVHRVPDDTPISNAGNNFKLHVVYFLNGMVNRNYMDWCTNQMNVVANWPARIYIVATLPAGHETMFRRVITSLYPLAMVSITTSNLFEYPGIRKVWEVARENASSQDLIFYFHSKGVTHTQKFAPHSNAIYTNLFEMQRIIEVFGTFPTVDKVGYYPSKAGWIWYNFWAARGSYLSTVEEPVITKRRHYYEDWLCRVPKMKLMEDAPINLSNYRLTPFSCYALMPGIEVNIGCEYDPSTGLIQQMKA